MTPIIRHVALLCTVVMTLVGAGPVPGAVAAAAAATAPAVTQVGPGAGPLAPTKVVLTGRNLKRADAVMFGTRPGKIVSRAGTSLELRTPRGAKAGTVFVRVHTPRGWSPKTKAARYTFVGKPTLKLLSPATGAYTGGQLVTLTGTELGRTRGVRFGDVAATIVSKKATKVVVRTPLGVLGGVPVKVTTPGGTSGARTFTYVGSTPEATRTAKPVAGAYTAATILWVDTAVDDLATDPDGRANTPWLVGLPAGALAPTVGQAFLVPPGTPEFITGLAGTVESVAVQPDTSLRVSVAPTDLESTMERLSADFAGPVDLSGLTGSRPGGRRDAESAVEWPINGSSLLCKDQDGNSVAFGADLTMRVSDVDVSQHLDLGGFFSKPTFDGSFTAEVETTGKFHGAAASTCSTSDAWQNAARRVIPLGTTGLTISFAPTFEFEISAKGTLTIHDRTRTTWSVSAKLGETPDFDKTSRTIESTVGGAFSFEATLAGGVQVQFGILDRVGVQGTVLLGLNGALEVSIGDDANVCVTVKVVLELAVGLFFDAWVVRWESPELKATIDLFELFSRCVVAETEIPGTTEPRITSDRLADSYIGEPYGASLSTEDGRAGTWSVARGPLPDGLTLDPTGYLSGTPTGPVGDYPVLVDFIDELGQAATSTIRVKVKPERGIGGGDIQVTLEWTGPADLDLHVIDPLGEEIYYRYRTSTTGGQLDYDANAGCNGAVDDDQAIENVFWPPNAAPVGDYAARVVTYAVCEGPLDWHLTIRRDGVVIVDQTGNGTSEGIPFSVGARRGGPAPTYDWAESYPAK